MGSNRVGGEFSLDSPFCALLFQVESPFFCSTNVLRTSTVWGSVIDVGNSKKTKADP